MTSRSTRDIQRALLSKGFRQHDLHHRYLELFVDGKASGIRTYLSHGTKDYGDGLLARVAQQLHLSKRELLQLIDCDLDEAGYLSLLNSQGLL